MYLENLEHNYLSRLKVRFWTKVEKRSANECWPWRGASKRKGGYGTISIHGNKVNAHRLSYELSIGPIPSGEGYHGTCVLHKCDNPSCVNPFHLYLGTAADNMRDMMKKGRGYFKPGEKHPNAKLSNEEIAALRNLRADKGLTHRELGERFGISHVQVGNILNGVWWSGI